MYKVSFYTPPGKISPISKFLSSCQPSLRAKVLRKLKYVEGYGLSPVIPDIKRFTGTPLWELRILGKENIRIFCGSLPKNEIKILHIFKKKTQKTRAKEILLALKRYQEADITPLST